MHQLYNNAGVALSRSVLETGYADYEWLFAVNLWGDPRHQGLPAAGWSLRVTGARSTLAERARCGSSRTP